MSDTPAVRTDEMTVPAAEEAPAEQGRDVRAAVGRDRVPGRLMGGADAHGGVAMGGKIEP